MADEKTSKLLLNAALEYAARGWAVLPVHTPTTNGGCSCGRGDCGKNAGKHPRITEWQKRATTDEATIRRWWNRWPDANIGINPRTSGLVVIDVDPRNGGDETWHKLKQQHGLNDDTVTSQTGGGGLHLLYAANGCSPAKLAVRLGPGVDVQRGDKQIVVPPSLHLSGDCYRWELSGHPDDMDPLPLPPSLLALLLKMTPSRVDSGDIPDGRRDDTLIKIAGGLRRKGKNEAEILAALLVINAERCKPPLPRGAIEKIAKSVAKYPPEPRVEAEAEKKERRRILTAEYIEALRKLGYTFRMNSCNDMIEVNGVAMTDAQRSKIRTQLRDAGYPRVNVAEDAWIACGFDNQYHPVRDYLDALEWDGRDHISTLSNHFADEHGFFPLFLTRWLIGAVAKAFENGCQNRMLILDGIQGIGKSHFVRWLSSGTGRPELAVEGPIVPDNKDDKVRLMGTWIWEVSEVGSTTRRADREALKYFLSMQQVTVRKPYGRYDLVKPALSSFIGTVNNVSGFLNDPTGYRRFMAVALTDIDWSYTEVDVGQVWGQTRALYAQGERWELDAQESEMADFVNGQYEVEDPLIDLIEKYYEITDNPIDTVTTLEVREILNQNGWRLKTPRGEAMAIAAGMMALNVRRGKERPRGFVGIRRKQINV